MPNVLDRLAAAAESGENISAAVEASSRRVDLDPLDEHAQRRLMALGRAGDRGGAIRRYRACVAVLERELGVAPLAETTELYEAIRDAREAPDQGPVAGAVPFARPTQFVPPQPLAVTTPGRLPHVGRDAEVAFVLGAHRSASR